MAEYTSHYNAQYITLFANTGYAFMRYDLVQASLSKEFCIYIYIYQILTTQDGFHFIVLAIVWNC